ncbi:6259_t:CDS:2 [Funneliformis geosporum]|uniref:6259_t:CDS:1 n=1 Tax=Funneliformis geosporum TaxID=1117311 RepID=A0A9W4WUV9_9GLOM|nr:6259_t:CDS:2 [Funneliformis geosporum]
MARNLENPAELVRLDNHSGKGPHYHLDDKQTYFTWISWQETKKLFHRLACELFAIAGKKHLQPKNVVVFSDLATIYQVISQARLDLLNCLVEKQPGNIYQLAKFLGKDYANVWRDCQALNSLGVIKLKKIDKEIQPIARYEKIIFEFPIMRREHSNLAYVPSTNTYEIYEPHLPRKQTNVQGNLIITAYHTFAKPKKHLTITEVPARKQNAPNAEKWLKD